MSPGFRTAFFLSLFTAATALPAHTQANPSPALEVALEAIRHVQTIAPGTIVLLPARASDTTFTHAVAARIGLPTRTGAESDACLGDVIPQCPWKLGDDSVAVRLRIESISPSAATVLVETWGVQRGSVGSTERFGFYDRRRLTFARVDGRWSLSRKTVLFQT